MPRITRPMIRVRACRGNGAKAQVSTADSAPGLTVVRRPSAFNVGAATCAGRSAAGMRIPARAAKPLWTGPGALASTSTPYGRSSTCSPSASACTYALVAA